MKRNLLLTPGPTKIPPHICEALGRPIIHHRTPQFQQYLKEVVEGLKYVFQTKNDIYLFPASGTGVMEAAVVNLLSAGDKAITVESGKFGERWTELCQAYGISADVIQTKWGFAVTADHIKQALAKNPDAKAVFITLCETSTGATPDVKAIAAVVRESKAVLVIDAISGMGSVDLQMDNWGVDMVVSASHKGFMLPPGLAFVAANARAWKLIEASKSPRYYFDLRHSKKAWEQVDTPFTTAIGIVVALIESLKFYKEQGLQNVYAHHARLAKATRAAAEAMGMSVYTDVSCRSNALTTILLPESINGEKLVKELRDTHGISMAGGQGDLKGKVVRIAHMGCVDEDDILLGLEYLEKVLLDMGFNLTQGAGVKAAKAVFNKEKVSTTE